MEIEVKSFTKAVEEFLKEADWWLTEEDYPATVALQHMAAQLDIEMTPALLSQYGLTYRSLLKKRPAAEPETDELEDLLGEV